MKKVFLLALVLMLAIGATVSAQDLSVNLSGGYLFGKYEDDADLSATHKGIVLSADAVISGPFGAIVNFSSLESSEFEIDDYEIEDGIFEQTSSRFDILATYALPVEGGKVKAALGYTNSSIDWKRHYEVHNDSVATATMETDPVYDVTDEQDCTISGAMVGLAGEFSPMDKLTLTGFAGFGLGLNVDGTRTEWDGGYYDVEIEDECNLTVLKAAAAYQVAENVAIEAGYEYNKYAFDGNDFALTISGFFLGARASF